MQVSVTVIVGNFKTFVFRQVTLSLILSHELVTKIFIWLLHDGGSYHIIQSKSVDWFLYDKDNHHEKGKHALKNCWFYEDYVFHLRFPLENSPKYLKL